MIGISKLTHRQVAAPCFRIWIVRCAGWKPTHWRDEPPHGQVLELAEQDTLSRQQADSFLQGFNQAMLGEGSDLWAVAVAVAVTLRYEGDLQPGIEWAQRGRN